MTDDASSVSPLSVGDDDDDVSRYAVEHTGDPTVRSLGPTPTIHPTATISESYLGEWTDVRQETRLSDSELGAYSYLMERCEVAHTVIGKFCSIASHVRLNPGNHPLWRPTTHHMTYRRSMYDLAETDGEAVFAWRRDHPVEIGHDVWIGYNATVMPDVTVGTGAVIGAGAVVTTDVDPYEIVAGVPAEPLDRRFDEETAESLLEMQWWDWSRETIEERFTDFRDLESFIEKYG